jgi:hypothetical protein
MINGVKLCRKKPNQLIGDATFEIKKLNNGDWTDYLPEHELQTRWGFETWSCVIHNGCKDPKEAVMMFMLKNNMIPPADARWLKDNGYFKDGFINFDDRIPAMHANIENGMGTFVHVGANAARDWNLPEGFLKDNPKNFQQWIDKKRITKEARDLNDEFNKRFKWKWWWTMDENRETVTEALKSSPLGVTGRYADGSGCLFPTGAHQHMMTLYKEDECYSISDSYNQRFKRYKKTHLANFIGWTLITNDMPKFIPENNKLYLLVEGAEQKLAMGLDGRLVVYNEKIDALLNSTSRSKQYQIPTPLTLEKWNSADKINGKGEEI